MIKHTIKYSRNFISLNEIIRDLTEIPDVATCLDLRCYSFLERFDLDFIFRSMPKHITQFHLVKMQLGNKPENLSSLFTSLAQAQNITSLSLMGNMLFLKGSQELANSFSTIPTNIQSLNLELSGLEFYSIEKLTSILKALPDHIVELTMSCHEICFDDNELARTADDLRSIGEALPYLLQLNLINTQGCEISEDNHALQIIRSSMGHWSKNVAAFCYEAMNSDPKAPLLPKNLVFEVLSFLAEPPFELNSQVSIQNYFNQVALISGSTENESKPLPTVSHF